MSDPATNGVCAASSGLNWSAYSLQGAARVRNSDAYAVFDRDGTQVFALADGVGSMPGAPFASRAASDAVKGAADLGLLDAPPLVDEALELVSQSVAYALEQEGARGATTLAIALLSNGSTQVISVGDSEVHAIEASGPSHLLHELDHVPNRPNVLLAWIDGETQFEPHRAAIPSGATHLCLMSDGVPGKLTNDDVARIIRTAPIESAARELVLAARKAGATDDLTAMVVALPVRSDS